MCTCNNMNYNKCNCQSDSGECNNLGPFIAINKKSHLYLFVLGDRLMMVLSISTNGVNVAQSLSGTASAGITIE